MQVYLYMRACIPPLPTAIEKSPLSYYRANPMTGLVSIPGHFYPEVA